MLLWRISNYASLEGIGGFHVSGRWHTKGKPVLYCSENPSTCLLEVIVHMELDAEDRPETFRLIQIEGPEGLSMTTIVPEELPENWPHDFVATQRLGDRWLASRRSLLLKVPSVLIPKTWNVVVNPLHPEAALLKISAVYEHAFDLRLFS